MASKSYWLLCLLCCFFELIHFYHKGVEAIRFSKYEDLDFEEEVMLLNKTWTKHGKRYTYTCLNVEKEDVSTRSNSFQPKNKRSCPVGTIAIKGTTRKNLTRAKLSASYKLFTTDEPGTHYAVVRKTGTFFGGEFTTSIWNPIVSGSQYSSTQMKLQSGQDSIETGWMVNPSLYNDARTRLFVYTKAGNKHCFNAYCGLFISEGWNINGDIPLISKKGGPIYVATMSIHREASSGDWVLQAGSGKRLGHWPKSNFKDLGNSATLIEWGSKVFSPTNIPSPPMGSGESKLIMGSGESKLVVELQEYYAYCRNLQIMDESNNFVPVKSTTTYTDTKAYQVRVEGFSKDPGYVMYYSGAGGVTGN